MKLTRKYLLPSAARPDPNTLRDLEANAIYSLMNRFDNAHHSGAGSPLLPPFCGGSLSAYRDSTSTDIQQANDYHHQEVSTLVDELLAICPPVTIAASTATMTMEDKEKQRQVMVVTPPTTPDRPRSDPFCPPSPPIDLSAAAAAAAAATANEKSPPRRTARLPKNHPSPRTKTTTTTTTTTTFASTSGGHYSSSLPTSLDPADESFAAILHAEADTARINPVHVAVRRDVLAIRRTKSGKVFFQCRCCRHLPLSQRAKLSVVSPQCVGNLYRSFVRFMMVHASSCEHLPAHVGALLRGGGKRGFSKARSGIKEYWASSALGMGLADGEDGMSIEYRPPISDRDGIDVAAVAVADLFPSA